MDSLPNSTRPLKKKIYLLYRGIIMTIPNRLILYVGYITPTIFRLWPSPCPTSTTARGFIVLFHIGIQSPSTMFLYLNLFRSSSLLRQVPPKSVLQSCLSLLISKSMFKEASQCIPTVIILYFCPFNPFH
jgi:hypothetical protein